MGEAGHRRIERRFTWQETARQTVALYEEVLAGREERWSGKAKGVSGDNLSTDGQTD